MLRLWPLTLLAFALSCSSTQESSRSPRLDDKLTLDPKAEYEGRYRFKTKTQKDQSLLAGHWGELLITRDRMLRIFRSADLSEVTVHYGRIQFLQPGVVEYRSLQHSTTSRNPQEKTPPTEIETYYFALEPGRSLVIKSGIKLPKLGSFEKPQTDFSELPFDGMEEWIPVGITP